MYSRTHRSLVYVHGSTFCVMNDQPERQRNLDLGMETQFGLFLDCKEVQNKFQSCDKCTKGILKEAKSSLNLQSEWRKKKCKSCTCWMCNMDSTLLKYIPENNYPSKYFEGTLDRGKFLLVGSLALATCLALVFALGLEKGLEMGLVFDLALDLVRNLVRRLSLGLLLGLLPGLTLDFKLCLAFGSVLGLALGLELDFFLYLALDLALELMLGMVLGLMLELELELGLVRTLALGLAPKMVLSLLLG